MDAENAELFPEAIELHLAVRAVYELSQKFRVLRGRIEVGGGCWIAEQGLVYGEVEGRGKASAVTGCSPDNQREISAITTDC